VMNVNPSGKAPLASRVFNLSTILIILAVIIVFLFILIMRKRKKLLRAKHGH
jgi:energy-converting hydrogenase Eha subunit H